MLEDSFHHYIYVCMYVCMYVCVYGHKTNFIELVDELPRDFVDLLYNRKQQRHYKKVATHKTYSARII